MTSWHRFDLLDSSYAMALMADRTPAWREVYSQILDELVARHTSWWAGSDWLTQFGHDPDRGNYHPCQPPLPPASALPSGPFAPDGVLGWCVKAVENEVSGPREDR